MAKAKQQRRAAHDHDRCIRRAVSAAERVCAAKQISLTPLRKRILEIVWRQHEPIGAYEILAEIAKDREKAAPPTVYRALEFLQDAGLVHRLDSLNAFLGCERPESPHAAQFLVCGNCRRVAEIEDPVLNRALLERARALGFHVEDSAVEIKARCTECARANPS
jgi:Fur family transcriptional regulator, zinc uptake regulator